MFFFNVIFRRKYRQYWQCEQNCWCAQECLDCAANPIESCVWSMMMDCWYEFSESSSDWRSVCEQDSRVWRCPLHRDICLGMRFDYDLITVSNVLFMDLHVYINLSLVFFSACIDNTDKLHRGIYFHNLSCFVNQCL